MALSHEELPAATFLMLSAALVKENDYVYRRKNIAKEFLKLYAKEQVVIDTLAEIQDNGYIHSDRWSLVFDMLDENFHDWRKATTGLVYLVEDGELEKVLNALNNDIANVYDNESRAKSVEDIIADATDRVVGEPFGMVDKELDV